MDPKFTQKLKKAMLEERQRLLNNSTTSRKSEFAISSEDLADEVDLTSVELSQGIVFTLREKEQHALSDIDTALQKIAEGTYGLCEDCEEPIAVKRLELNPTARLCVKHQEEIEKRKKMFAA